MNCFSYQKALLESLASAENNIRAMEQHEHACPSCARQRILWTLMESKLRCSVVPRNDLEAFHARVLSRVKMIPRRSEEDRMRLRNELEREFSLIQRTWWDPSAMAYIVGALKTWVLPLIFLLGALFLMGAGSSSFMAHTIGDFTEQIGSSRWRWLGVTIGFGAIVPLLGFWFGSWMLKVADSGPNS